MRGTDALVHVVRLFDDDNGVHVAGRIDPVSDIEVINTELALADLATADKAWQKNLKLARSGDKEAARLVALLERVVAALNEGRAVRSLALDGDDNELVRQY